MILAAVLLVPSFSMGRCGSGEGGRGCQAGSNGGKHRKAQTTMQYLDAESGAEISRISFDRFSKQVETKYVGLLLIIWFRLCTACERIMSDAVQ